MATHTFAADIRGWAQKQHLQIDTAVRIIALACLRNIVLMSPVDTGRFQSNWMVATGGPAGTYDMDARKSATVVVQEGAATIQSIVGLPRAIWISNHLPYAVRLEYGWSKQAPGGMVRITAERFAGALSKEAAR